MSFKINRLIFIAMFALCCAYGLQACRSSEEVKDPTIQLIKARGTLLVGTTGDYMKYNRI